MKQIIILLLIIIVAIVGFGQYKKHKRFSLSEYEYKVPETINITNADKGLLLDYYEAVEVVNGYVITQWSSNAIDVKNPDDDDAEDVAAVTEYRKRLANVKFYEAQLLSSSEKQKSVSDFTEADKKKSLIQKAFYSNPNGNLLQLGEQSAMAYEIQGILISKGDEIQQDGLFSTETFNALQAFESKNGLFPDGELDAITLEYLLK